MALVPLTLKVSTVPLPISNAAQFPGPADPKLMEACVAETVAPRRKLTKAATFAKRHPAIEEIKLFTFIKHSFCRSLVFGVKTIHGKVVLSRSMRED